MSKPFTLKAKIDAALLLIKPVIYHSRPKLLSESVEQASQAIIQAVDEAMEQVIGDEKIVLLRKPTHGNCCTCQDCGMPHDDCNCGEIETRNELRTEQRTRKKAILEDPATLNNNNNRSGDS